jgi:hypothetical protein
MMDFDCSGQLQIDLSDMHYLSYGGPEAKGTATVFIGEPACALCARPVTEAGTFTLGRIERCPDGRRYYSSASETTDRPYGSLRRTITYGVAPTPSGLCSDRVG